MRFHDDQSGEVARKAWKKQSMIAAWMAEKAGKIVCEGGEFCCALQLQLLLYPLRPWQRPLRPAFAI